MNHKSWDRIILHADMDAFFAAVEQRDNPEFRGKPVVVGGNSKRGVVSTASYEARRFGLRSAMSMVEALRRCPDVIVVPPDFERYKEASEQIMEVFREYSPLVEPLSIDEAFLDMTGAGQIFGTPKNMGERIKQDVLKATSGLTVSVGISTNKYIAKVASDMQKPDGLTVILPGNQLEFLWPLPVKKLWGVGPRSQKHLEALGLKTIGDVANFDAKKLETHLGVLGVHVWNLANGYDPRQVTPPGESKSVGKEYTLQTDIVGEEKIVFHLRRGADNIARQLRLKGLMACGVRVKLKTNRFKLLTRQTTIAPATDSASTLMKTAQTLLPYFDLSQPMRLVGITAFNLKKEAVSKQGELFPSPEIERNRRLDKAMDSVVNRFGTNALKRGDDLE